MKATHAHKLNLLYNTMHKNSNQFTEHFANPKNICAEPETLYKFNVENSPKEIQDPFHQWQEFDKNIT